MGSPSLGEHDKLDHSHLDFPTLEVRSRLDRGVASQASQLKQDYIVLQTSSLYLLAKAIPQEIIDLAQWATYTMVFLRDSDPSLAIPKVNHETQLPHTKLGKMAERSKAPSSGL